MPGASEKRTATAAPIPAPAARTWGGHGLAAMALVGLGVSALLTAEYAGGPVVCGVGGGCDAVRDSAFSEPAGVPLPLIGVAYFAGVLALGWLGQFRSLLLVATGIGALVGVGLLAVQALLLGVFCALCVGVDLSALLLPVFVWAGRGEPAPTPRAIGVQIAASLAVVMGAFGVHAALERPRGSEPVSTQVVALPPEIVREQQPGAVTVVEFLDFQCPACRAQHGQMKPVLEEFGEDVRLVVKHVPLPQHAHAEAAARAYCCAEEQGRAAAMADALFSSEVPTAEECESIARQLELDIERFRECIGSERVTARLRGDMQTARAVGVHSLPTYFVGRERFIGIHSGDAVRESIERARERM